MLYSAFEMGITAFSPARLAAGLGSQLWRSPLNPAAETWFGRSAAAALEVFEHATRRYPKPDWLIDSTEVNGRSVPVTVETFARKDFCSLLHFKRDADALRLAKSSGNTKASDAPDPAVLIVAPLSGHHATLLRGTVEAMLPEHDVYITDWLDARSVPITLGRFDLNDFIDYLIDFLRLLKPLAPGAGVHTL
ncbi:MAG: polyhydroxyalkanoate depolymerase, partial [Pseudomonadota bacterium]